MERGKEPLPEPAGAPGQTRRSTRHYLTAAGLPHHRAIVALDIEQSTRRPDPVKAELRGTMYELFDAALHSAGIQRRHRDRFVDRGDGVLALVHPVDQAPKAVLLNRAIPALNQLLADDNAALPRSSQPQRLLRVRAVVHAGEVSYDANGCFGEALDVAFRLLDAPQVKVALRVAADPLALVISDDIYRTVVRHGFDGIDQRTFHPLVSVEVAGHQHSGWIRLAEEGARRRLAEEANPGPQACASAHPRTCAAEMARHRRLVLPERPHAAATHN